MELAHSDGSTTVEDVLTGQYSHEIRSVKDIFQYYHEDVRALNRDIKRSLR